MTRSQACLAIATAALANQALAQEARPGRDYLCHTIYACEESIGCAKPGGPRVHFMLKAADFGTDIGPGFHVVTHGPEAAVLFFHDLDTARKSVSAPRPVPENFKGLIVPDHSGNWQAVFRLSSVTGRLTLEGFAHRLTTGVSRIKCVPRGKKDLTE